MVYAWVSFEWYFHYIYYWYLSKSWFDYWPGRDSLWDFLNPTLYRKGHFPTNLPLLLFNFFSSVFGRPSQTKFFFALLDQIQWVPGKSVHNLFVSSMTFNLFCLFQYIWQLQLEPLKLMYMVTGTQRTQIFVFQKKSSILLYSLGSCDQI